MRAWTSRTVIKYSFTWILCHFLMYFYVLLILYPILDANILLCNHYRSIYPTTIPYQAYTVMHHCFSCTLMLFCTIFYTSFISDCISEFKVCKCAYYWVVIWRSISNLYIMNLSPFIKGAAVAYMVEPSMLKLSGSVCVPPVCILE